MNYQEILDFWFDPVAKPKTGGLAKMMHLMPCSKKNLRPFMSKRYMLELWSWRSSAEGRLAEIIVLDQLSRNLYRNSPLAFAQDALALALAQEAIT